MNIQYVIDSTGHPTNVIMPFLWYQQLTQESISRPIETFPSPLTSSASPADVLDLFTHVYDGWSTAEMEEVESIILNRQRFFKGPKSLRFRKAETRRELKMARVQLS